MVVVLVGAVVLLAYFALTPLLMLFYSSLSDAPPGTVGNLTLANYARAYLDPEFYPLFWNTLKFALGSALLSFFLGSFLAWICERTNAPLRGVIATLVLVLFIVPGILETVAWILLLSPQIGLINLALRKLLALPEFSLNVYSFAGMIWAESMNLYPLVFLLMSAAFRSQDTAMEEASLTCGAGNFTTLRWILLIAYMTKYLPYGIRTASASMIQIGKELEEASMVSGASWLQTFGKIVLPLLMPGFVAGWIYIAVVSLRELATSILLYTQHSIVLSILVFDLWESGLYSSVSALGVLMVLFLIVVAWAARRIGARIGYIA